MKESTGGILQAKWAGAGQERAVVGKEWTWSWQSGGIGCSQDGHRGSRDAEAWPCTGFT